MEFKNCEDAYVPENREVKEIKRLQQRALREFFLRPGVILRHVLTALRHPALIKKYAQGAVVLLAS